MFELHQTNTTTLCKSRIGVLLRRDKNSIYHFRFELDLDENEENEETVVASLDMQMQQLYGKILMAWWKALHDKNNRKVLPPKKLTFSILDLNSFKITFSQFLSVFFNEVWYYFLEKTYIHAPFVLSLLSHPHTLCHVIFNACLRSFHTKYLMHISVCFIFAPPKPKFNVNTILFENYT